MIEDGVRITHLYFKSHIYILKKKLKFLATRVISIFRWQE